MLLAPWEGWMRVLLISWLLAFVALLLYALYKVFYAPPPEDAGAASGTTGTADEEPTTPGRSMSHDDGRGLYSSRSQPLLGRQTRPT